LRGRNAIAAQAQPLAPLLFPPAHLTNIVFIHFKTGWVALAAINHTLDCSLIGITLPLTGAASIVFSETRRTGSARLIDWGNDARESIWDLASRRCLAIN
jgi:hypothetical protein